jgi:glutamate-1-semialdehyde 2,1-aminomutase
MELIKNNKISKETQSIDMNRYVKHFPTSGKMFEKAKKYLPGGVGSTSRAIWSGWNPYPLFIDKGIGSHVIDVDGNEFIDYLLGLGPMLLGHRPEKVTNAVIKQISEAGTVFALGSKLEIDVSKKVCDSIPGMEQIRFVNSGTEAVTYALRLARTYTGRKKIIRFEGMYHGFSDGIYWNKHPSPDAIDQLGNCIPEPQGPGLPEGIKDTLLICQWNDLDALSKIIKENYMDIAAIITEPVMCNTGCILPKPGYLQEMRKLATDYGIILIFDEVITGFRIGFSGAQGYYGVIPDLSVFAKGLGGGYPVAALGGKKEIMRLVDIGQVSIAGTYSGNGIALSAVSATMDYLSNKSIYEELNRKSTMLRTGLDKLLKKSKIPAYVTGIGAVFQIWFADNPITNYREAIKYANDKIFHAWWKEMLYQGVLFHPHYFENLFVSTAHTDADVESTLIKAEKAIATLKKKM